MSACVSFNSQLCFLSVRFYNGKEKVFQLFANMWTIWTWGLTPAEHTIKLHQLVASDLQFVMGDGPMGGVALALLFI